MQIIRRLGGKIADRLDVVKGIFYVVFGSALSAVVIALQREFRPLYVSSIFKLTFNNITGLSSVYRSTAGYLRPGLEHPDRECTLRVILPFDIPPPAIPPQYLCSWDPSFDQSSFRDAICYTNFDCRGPGNITALYLSAATLLLISYLILGGVVLSTRLGVLHIRSKFIYWFIVTTGVVTGIVGFGISKTVTYLTDIFLEEVFEKIRAVTVYKGGVTGLTFEVIHYVLDFRTNVSRTLLDILAGFSLGFIFIVWETYKKLFKPPSHL